MISKLLSHELSALNERFLGFESFFHAHAAIEDISLFPFIRDDLKMEKEAKFLMNEHKELLDKINEGKELLKELSMVDFKGPTYPLLLTLQKIQELLLKHLEDEEKIVIDIILEHGWKGVIDQ